MEESCQIANFADFCNACGNCDTFCPEYGGPFIRKPQVFGDLHTWQRLKTRDGFAVSKTAGSCTIHGRIRGEAYVLTRNASSGDITFSDRSAVVTLTGDPPVIASASCVVKLADAHRVDTGILIMMRTLLDGMMDTGHIHPVNARL